MLSTLVDFSLFRSCILLPDLVFLFLLGPPLTECIVIELAVFFFVPLFAHCLVARTSLVPSFPLPPKLIQRSAPAFPFRVSVFPVPPVFRLPLSSELLNTSLLPFWELRKFFDPFFPWFDWGQVWSKYLPPVGMVFFFHIRVLSPPIKLFVLPAFGLLGPPALY